MIKYYIIPVVVEADNRKPMYIDEFPSDQPVKVAALFPIGDYYLIKVNTENQAVFDFFESKQEVFLVTRQLILSNLQRLSQIGMDTTGLNGGSSTEELQQRVVEFVSGNIATFSEAFGLNGER